MSNYLPRMEHIHEWHEGRNVREGYIRGWGLEFGELRGKIKNDPDFGFCFELINGRSIVSMEKVMNLFLIIKFYLPQLMDGNEPRTIVEFGCYRGGTAIFIAALVNRLALPVQVVGLDTFEGMPDTDRKYDVHSKGDFKKETLKMWT